MSAARLAPIVFSHANGFPAGTYRQLFDAWRSAGHEVHAIDRLGHDTRHPVTSNWPHLRDELVAFVQTTVGGPAMLVGHSLGGILSLIVAAERPDLAAGVVLLDSPLIAGWRAHTLHVAKVSGLVQRVSPGRVARKRRNSWPSQAAVREHFQRKAVFATWDPRVLDDYVASGFIKRGHQWQLAFDRDVEATIYDTLPHHVAPLLARKPLRCPLAFVGGRESAEARQAGVAATKRLAGDLFVWTAGTHLFPMEHPDEAAQLVLQMIHRMTASTQHVQG
jgi:pimeloyl-ACP methyl ester carboxylesterase